MSKLAGGVFAAIIVFTGASLWLAVGAPEGMFAPVAVSIWLLAVGGIGALLGSRHPENPIGWLMLSISMVLTLHGLASAYAGHALIEGHALSGAEFAAWATLWLLVPGFALFIPLLLLFPSGKLPSSRWRWVLRLTWLGMASTVLGLALKPGPIDLVRKLNNPVGVEGGMTVVLSDGGETLLTTLTLLAIASLFFRFRRASGTEREQIKWFVYAVAMIPVLLLLGAPVDAIDGDGDSYGQFIVNMTAALLVPISLGVAILRNRLYDIDVIVNRTLVYGTLTAILAASYLGIVVVLQRILAPITADSDVAVAASTLAVAALFRPLRSRVQGFIDRRFYRRKYDAQRTLEEFAAHLRDEVDLHAVADQLADVVGETVQPTHVSLWLRTEATR